MLKDKFPPFQRLVIFSKNFYPPPPDLPHNPARMFEGRRTAMDWDQIIERNRERILLAIAPLLAVLGFDPKARRKCRSFSTPAHRPPAPRRSAVRRLIIIAARGIVIKLRLGSTQGFPAGLGWKLKKALEEDESSRPLASSTR